MPTLRAPRLLAFVLAVTALAPDAEAQGKGVRY
jgi:hypothetical protein